MGIQIKWTCHYLLFMHEVNGCETSSAPFGKGKKQALNIGLTSLRQIQTGNWTPITKEIFRYCYSTSHKCLLFPAFLQGIQWLGRDLNQTDWALKLSNELLLPVETNLLAAPKKILNMISCKCKKSGLTKFQIGVGAHRAPIELLWEPSTKG